MRQKALFAPLGRFIAAGALVLVACDGGGLKRTAADGSNTAVVPKKAPSLADKTLSVTAKGGLGTPSFAFGDMRDRPDLANLSHADAGRAYLREFAGTFDLDSEDRSLQLQQVHESKHGPVIVAFERRINGMPVFRDELKVAMTKDHRLVSVSGQVAPLGSLSDSAALESKLKFERSAEEALQFALADAAADTRVAGTQFIASPRRFAGDYTEYVAADVALPPSRARSVLFPTQAGLIPAHYIELELPTVDTPSTQFMAYVVSARDGALLLRLSQTADASYRVFAESGYPTDGVYSDYTPHPSAFNDGLAPRGYASTELTALNNLPNMPATDVWLPVNSQTSTGNNVVAYADLAAPDGFGAGDMLAVATSPNTFDYAYDPALAPGASDTQRLASVTQLFFMNNWLHDWFYSAGFDEASGNAQALNFNRGGLEGDALKAEAQDVSGTNNANMSTPADGKPPRMQMFVFSVPADKSAAFSIDGAQPFPPVFLGDSAFGPSDYDIESLVARGIDATGAPEGCTAPLSSDVAGKIAFIRRGPTPTVSQCTFALKAQNAAAAGAVAVVIYSNSSGNVGTLAGAGINIPGVFIDQATGDALAAELGAGKEVKLRITRAAPPAHDGTLDNQIVAHEWGHYLSNRLIGNAAGLPAAHQRGMGEGWADFVALMMTVREGDNKWPTNVRYAGAYPLAYYAIGEQTSHYHAIRRLPYSTDKSTNPLTFKHIVRGVALPELAPERTYLFTGDNAEVHNVGEVWAAMLWECYAALLNDTRSSATFEERREKMKAYLVASLKLTPPVPTFLEARDAVLAAARAESESDFLLFAEAFAKRGAGLRAVAPDRFTADNVGTEESFLTGNDVALVSATLVETATSCAAAQDGVLDNGESAALSVTIRNTGYGKLTAPVVNISNTLQSGTLSGPTAITFSDLAPFASETRTVEIGLLGATDISQLTLGFSVTDASVNLPPSTGELSVVTNYDVVASDSLTDDVSAPRSTFVPKRDTTLALGEFSREEVEGNTLWFGPNLAATGDIFLLTPIFAVAPGEDFTFGFDHWFGFESDAQAAYDGGVVEYTTDGFDWFDVNTIDASIPYNGVLLAEGSQNPLAGRPAFVRQSTPAFPAFSRVELQFGRRFAGQNVRLRFRIGSDQGANLLGWGIDNVTVGGVTNKPFNTTVKDAGLCGNQKPIADAGLAQNINEAYTTRLDGSASRDLEGASLAYLWRQESGPVVQLADATSVAPSFVAPEVEVDTQLVFSLVVNDGSRDSDKATVTVTVLNVNSDPPPAEIIKGAVDERQELALSFEVPADLQGKSAEWVQVEGPSGELKGTGTLDASFVAPEVKSDTRVVLERRVSGANQTARAQRVVLTIRNVNRAPTAALKIKSLSLLPGALATLDATPSEDADGDDLAFEWRQVGGPKVELRDVRTAKPSFVVPKVVVQTQFAFEVVAFDASASSSAERVEVAVLPTPNNAVGTESDVIRPAERAGCSQAQPMSNVAMPLLGLAAALLARRTRRLEK